MAKGYRPVRRDQPFLLPPDMREWLAGDHPVFLVMRAVGRMDTSAFHARRRTGGAGTAGYDPDMLATLLVRAYFQGVASSRRVEELRGTDVAFRVVCGGNRPDHSTIARFRGDFAAPVERLFTEVLILCARLGMGKLGTVALDGTKVRANASKAANRTEETLARLAAERVAAHAETDAAEDALFGDARGDEVPAEAADPFTRDERIDAALASARAERVRKAEEKLAAAQAREAAAAEKAAQATARDAVIVRNITDPESRLMATRNGKQQCYNPQQVVSEDLLVIATELTDDPTGMAWFEPMMAQAEDAAALIRAHQPPAAPAPGGGDCPAGPAAGIGQALADCGYLSRRNLTCPGPDRLIATGKRRDLEKAAMSASQPGRVGSVPRCLSDGGASPVQVTMEAYLPGASTALRCAGQAHRAAEAAAACLIR